MRGLPRAVLLLPLILATVALAGITSFRVVRGATQPDFTITFDPSSVVYPQDSSTLMSNVVLTSSNGFSDIVSLEYRWYNGSSDIFVGLSNPSLTSGGTVSETIKILSPPLPHTGCCAILGVTGTSTVGRVSHSANLTIAIPSGPDFSLSTEQPSIVLFPGTHGSSSIIVTSTNNVPGRVFFGPAALEGPTVLSGGWSFYLDEAWLVPGGTGTVLFQVYAAPDAALGDYVFNLTGSSFSHTHSTSITVTVEAMTVGDFNLFAVPNTLIMSPGSTTTSNIVLHSLANFSGTVHLWTQEVSQCCPGPIINDPFAPRPSISPSTVRLTLDGSNSSTLTVDTAYPYMHGNYTMEIHAYSGTAYHTLNVTVSVSPVQNLFVITPASASVYATPGKTVNLTLSVNSTYGFLGTVKLSTSSSSGSIVGGLTPLSVSLIRSNGSGSSSATSTLTVSIAPNASPGQYLVTVRGDGGPYSYSTTITLVVSSSFSSPPTTSASSSNSALTILSLPPTALLIAAGGLAAGLVLAIALLARSPRNKQS